MDDIDDNQGKPQQELEPADKKVLQSVGIEIVNHEETAAEKEYAIEKKTAEMMGMSADWSSGKPERSFTQRAQVVPGKAGDIKSVRTYKTDAEEAVQGNKTSVIDIVVAENKKRERVIMAPEKEHESRGLLWFSTILIFIALVIVAGTYYFLVIAPGNSSPAVTNIQNYYPPIISVQTTKTISIDPKNPTESFKTALGNISSTPIGSTVNVVPLNSEGQAIATSSDFFSSLGITLPVQVKLSLNGVYTLGVVTSTINHPFMILDLSSFENAFAGMLGWEKTIHNDLATFIQVDHPGEPSVSIIPGVFTDKTINNQDVRELLDASSSPLLLYTFVGSTKLVITTNSDTMSSVISALNTTNTTR